MSKKPKRFHVRIGGYMGPSYSVQLVRSELQYKSCEQGYTNWKTETISVTGKQWETFRTAIDSLDVWQWEREYPNPGVLDGTHWDIDIASDMRIRSHGDNNYPKNDATESYEPEEGGLFDRFMSTLRSLVGGHNFQREISFAYPGIRDHIMKNLIISSL